MKNNTWRRLLAALIVCMMMVSGLNMLFANAEEPVTGEEPAATDNVEVPADEEPAEVPAEEEPADDEEPAGEEPVAEEPVAEEPVAEEPVAEEPVAEEPVAEEPVVEEPVAEEPVAEEPVAEEPVAEEPVVEEPVAEEPVAEEPVTEEPVAEEPVVEEPVAEEPVAQAAANAPAEEMEFEDYETPLGGEYQTVVLEDDEVDVREGADGMSNIFKTLPAGATITVVGIDGDWAHVVVDEQEGYIYVDDLAGYIDLPEKETEEAADPRANMKVTIFTSRRNVMTLGEKVYLTSKLEGFEGYKVTYQWRCNKGNGYEDVPGANSDTYEFEATAETLSWGWILTVTATR